MRKSYGSLEQYTRFLWYVWFAACLAGDLGPSLLQRDLGASGKRVAGFLLRVLEAYCTYTPPDIISVRGVVILLVYFFYRRRGAAASDGAIGMQQLLEQFARMLAKGFESQRAFVMKDGSSKLYAHFIRRGDAFDGEQPPWTRRNGAADATYGYLLRLMSTMVPDEAGSVYDAVLDHSGLFNVAVDPYLMRTKNMQALFDAAEAWIGARENAGAPHPAGPASMVYHKQVSPALLARWQGILGEMERRAGISIIESVDWLVEGGGARRVNLLHRLPYTNDYEIDPHPLRMQSYFVMMRNPSGGGSTLVGWLQRTIGPMHFSRYKDLFDVDSDPAEVEYRGLRYRASSLSRVDEDLTVKLKYGFAGYVEFLESVIKNKNIGQILLLRCIVDMAREGLRAVKLYDASGTGFYRKKFAFISEADFMSGAITDHVQQRQMELDADGDAVMRSTNGYVILPWLDRWLEDEGNIKQFERMAREAMVPVVPSDVAHVLISARTSKSIRLDNSILAGGTGGGNDDDDDDDDDDEKGGFVDACRHGRHDKVMALLSGMDVLPSAEALQAAVLAGDDRLHEALLYNRGFSVFDAYIDDGGSNDAGQWSEPRSRYVDDALLNMVAQRQFDRVDAFLAVFIALRNLDVKYGGCSVEYWLSDKARMHGKMLYAVWCRDNNCVLVRDYCAFARKQFAPEAYGEFLAELLHGLRKDRSDVPSVYRVLFAPENDAAWRVHEQRGSGDGRSVRKFITKLIRGTARAEDGELKLMTDDELRDIVARVDAQPEALRIAALALDRIVLAA